MNNSMNKVPDLAPLEEQAETVPAMERLKGVVASAVAKTIFPRMRIYGAENLKRLPRPIILVTAHHSMYDPAIIYGLVKRIHPGVPLGICAEESVNEVWKHTPFARDIVFVANDEISVANDRIVPSPLSQVQRQRTRFRAGKAIRKIIEQDGIIIIQAFGMPKSDNYRRKEPIPGIRGLLESVLHKKPGASVVACGMTGGVAPWKDFGNGVGIHQFWKPTEVRISENMNTKDRPMEAIVSEIGKYCQ